MKTETYELPAYWASALVDGDYSHLADDDFRAIEAFTDDMMRRHGKCWCLSVNNDGSADFRRYHDATRYGVLACDVEIFTFDITPR